MVGNMTVGAWLCAYVCKASCGRGENKRKLLYITGGDVLDERRMIGLVLAFSLVLMHSPTADTCWCLLGHVCPCLWLCDHSWDCVCYLLVIGVAVWTSGWGEIPNWGCGARYSICARFQFGWYICVSGCVIEVYTMVLRCVLSWLCGSVFVSGISGVFQPLLMYRLIT